MANNPGAGRPRTSVNVKRALGKNVGDVAEPQPEKYRGRKRSCPPHIASDPVAKAEWDKVTKILRKAGILTEADLGILAMYCHCFSIHMAALADYAEDDYQPILRPPDSCAYAHPALKVMDKQKSLMERYMVQLGLTPQSRTRLAVPASAGKKNKFTALADKKHKAASNTTQFPAPPASSVQ